MVHTPSKHLNDPLCCSQGATAGVIDGVANQPARVQQLRQPELDGVPLASNLLGCTRFKTVGEKAQLEPLILGGDDVLDFGTGLGLLQGESVDQDALVGGIPVAARPLSSAKAQLAAARARMTATFSSSRAGGSGCRNPREADTSLGIG